MENFITFIMAFQLKSGSSHFYHHYRKFHEKQREFYPNYNYGERFKYFPVPFEEEDELCLVCLKREIDKLDPYNKMIAEEHLMQGENITAISKKYNIPFGHIKRDKELIIVNLKRKCRQYL